MYVETSRSSENGPDSRPKHVGANTTNIKLCNKLVIQTSMREYIVKVSGRILIGFR